MCYINFIQAGLQFFLNKNHNYIVDQRFITFFVSDLQWLIQIYYNFGGQMFLIFTFFIEQRY